MTNANNMLQIAQIFIAVSLALSLLLDAVAYSTDRWAIKQKVPVNRFHTSTTFEAYANKRECRFVLCQILNERREASMTANIYRGLSRRCELVYFTDQIHTRFVTCTEEHQSLYDAKVVKHLQFAALITLGLALLLTLVQLIILVPNILCLFIGFLALTAGVLIMLAVVIFDEHLLRGESVGYSFCLAASSIGPTLCACIISSAIYLFIRRESSDESCWKALTENATLPSKWFLQQPSAPYPPTPQTGTLGSAVNVCHKSRLIN